MFRCCCFLFALGFSSAIFAAPAIHDKECDSNRIHYTWIEKYGEVERPNARGQTLFQSATDKMEVFYASGEKGCFEAYVLVVDHILTMPRREQRNSHENREYLANKLEGMALSAPYALEDVLMLAPSINMLWNGYQDYLTHRDALEQEHQELALMINTQACEQDYDYQRDGADYDLFMDTCVNAWK